mgnify:FL=1|tara:strand:- start:4000 stop:4578 length:579 start_codon:yes stop_codon:yes gene_type:complete
MITQINGKLIEKSPTSVVIDCHGVGYEINISLNTYSKIHQEENIKLYTHLIIKEDSHSLYGFFEKKERNLFKYLISVSGVGASTARMMLSSMSIIEIESSIITENFSKIQTIKGIGLKTAQRIVLELKDKITVSDDGYESSVILSKEINEAVSALEVLGYSKKQTTKIISVIVKDNPGINIESLIKKALNKL